MNASRKRRLSILALALLGGLTGLALALPGLAAAYLPEMLRLAGFKQVALTVRHAGWSGLELSDIALDHALSAKQLTFGFSPLGLSRFEAKNLVLKARTDGKSLTVGPLTLPFSGGASGSGLDLPQIRLDQARFDLDTPAGNIQGSLNSEPEGAATRLRLELSSGSSPALISPLILTGIVTEDGPSLRFAGRLNDPMHRLLIQLSGSQNLEEHKGSAEIALQRIEFAPGHLQPQTLFPILGPYVKEVEGPIDGTVHLAWQNGKLTSDARIASHGLSFESHGAVVRNLMGTLTLDRIWPPRTPTPQNFSVGMLAAGVPLGSGSFAFALEDDGSLFIKRAALNLADGKLRLDPMRLGPSMTGVLNFQARDVDLAKLAPLFQIQGMMLGGIVDGTLPVILDKDGVKVAEAKLTARQKGFVRYRPQTVPPALQAGGEAVSLLMAALKDFHYDSLALSLDGQAGGETTVMFHIKGRNPGLSDGTPFEFNFRLTGPLDQLARQAWGVVSLPDDIEAALAEQKR